MGQEVQEQRLCKNIQLLNRTKEKYDWNNEELGEIEGLVEDTVPSPDINSEMTGIELDSEQTVIVSFINDNK